jgi:MFS superfamily sulfate permease-like transporter
VSFLKKLKIVPGALVAVVVSVLLNELFNQVGSSLAIAEEHLVQLPVPESFEELKTVFLIPDFSAITNSKVWIVAFTIAIVASIETLLCIEAADKMDPDKRFTDTNIELKAQGIGNMISAMLGGLPMTSVVVRTSANTNAGAKSKLSAIIHGVLLLISVFSIPALLNKIPYATLAAVLLMVGYKLANPKTVLHFWKKDKIFQFIPFIATFVFVVLTDLLKGVALGMAINVVFILIGNSKRAYSFRKEEYHDGDVIHIDLAQEVSFLNKAAIKSTLNDIPADSKVIINASATAYIAHDVLDLISDFNKVTCKQKNIDLTLTGFKEAYNIEDAEPFKKSVTIEHVYDVAKRKMVVKSVEPVRQSDTDKV